MSQTEYGWVIKNCLACISEHEDKSEFLWHVKLCIEVSMFVQVKRPINNFVQIFISPQVAAIVHSTY